MRITVPMKLVLAAASVSCLASAASAQSILSPNDFIIGIDNLRNLPGTTQTGAEGPAAAFDGSDTTKWLSFGRTFTGLIVTPLAGSSVVQSLSFTTGGDAPERDPTQFQLFGTNAAITAVNNGTGLEDAWTLIGGGATGLGASTSPSLGRNVVGSPVTLSNSTAYTSYKVLFTKLRSAGTGAFDPVTLANASNPNSIQISEARLFAGIGGGGANISQGSTAVVAIDQTDSFNPPTERPIEAIDGSKAAGSKYLNFGREGAGLIVTPAMGSSVVRSFQITTANDTESRDPSGYQIFGTNAPIVSLEDSEGTAEAWTLITSGTMVLPTGRNFDGPLIGFDNNTAYTSYKVIFTDNKGPDTAGGTNSIQFSELAMFTSIPEPTAMSGLLLAGAALGSRRRKA